MKTNGFSLQNSRLLPTISTIDEDRAFTDVLWATMDASIVAIDDDIIC